MPREVVHDPFGEKARGLGVSGEAIMPSEVLARHGVGGNAEVLIQAVREHNPQALVAARAKRVNFPLRDALRKGELKGYEGVTSLADVSRIAGEGATVHDVNVRGAKSVTYAATDSQGALYHGTFELDDPEGTHISQAELLAQEGSVAAPIIGARRAAAAATDAARQAEQDAREKALADREKKVMEQERELEERRVALAEQAAKTGEPPVAEPGGGGSQPAAPGAPGTPATPGGGAAAGAPQPGGDAGDGNGDSKPERPAGLPANYDELDANEAAKVVHGLEGEQREQAIAYERQTKGRRTVTGDPAE
jgi:hypothetical protein